MTAPCSAGEGIAGIPAKGAGKDRLNVGIDDLCPACYRGMGADAISPAGGGCAEAALPVLLAAGAAIAWLVRRA